ncbi:hypothetical protein [Microbacterium natoriense]|uniref:hypothetical protein n=1 Tax=Microbacterium natoriense TaxID=284570 RepID=UPI0031CF0883
MQRVEAVDNHCQRDVAGSWPVDVAIDETDQFFDVHFVRSSTGYGACDGLAGVVRGHCPCVSSCADHDDVHVSCGLLAGESRLDGVAIGKQHEVGEQPTLPARELSMHTVLAEGAEQGLTAVEPGIDLSRSFAILVSQR